MLTENQKRLGRLTTEEFALISGYFQPMNFSAKAVLLEPGSISRTAWFVERGILRTYTMCEEKKRSVSSEDSRRPNREITNWIVQEGGFLTDVRSFLYQSPATCYIETLEPCRLYKLTYDNYLIIQHNYPDLSRVIFENTLIMADLRVQMCSLRNPADRLNLFERMYPEMLGRLSVNIQASYLNVDPATLSRLRGRKSSADEKPFENKLNFLI